MATYLSERKELQLPDHFIERFADLRTGTEKRLRFERSNEIERSCESGVHILAIYKRLLSLFAIDDKNLVETLIEIEQEIERSLIMPRDIGRTLFLKARHLGKKLVIVSDCCHSHSFVTDMLQRCGYSGWDRLYVFSEIGLSKHAGKFFDFVASDLHTRSENILHFGQNYQSDEPMTKKNSWNSRLLRSGTVVAKDLWHQRTHFLPNLPTFEHSIVCSAILSHYANRYLGVGDATNTNDRKTQLIGSREAFGYLVIGPLLHFFSRWILHEAKRDGVQQILFFEQNSWLSYQMLQKECVGKNSTDLNLCYVPVAKESIVCMDVFTPEDALKVSIDDLHPSTTLLTILEERFLINCNEIDLHVHTYLQGKNPENVLLCKMTPSLVYQIAVESYRTRWPMFRKRFEEKRALFQRALRQWGVDGTKRSMVVGLGYEGSIHKKVSLFFENPLIVCFFMATANTQSRDSVGVRVFPPGSESKEKNIFLRYGFLLETLCHASNDGVMEYAPDDSSFAHVQRDTNVDKKHQQAIREIHEGAMLFSQDWSKNCTALDRFARQRYYDESSALTIFFATVMQYPTSHEVYLLKNLTFAKGSADHKLWKFMYMQFGLKNESIWREGDQAINKDKIWFAPFRSKYPHSDRIRFERIVRFFIDRYASLYLVHKFHENPHAFFSDSQNTFVQMLGRLLLR